MSTARPITVGLTGSGYPEKRNIIDLPHEGVRFVRHSDPVQLLDLLYFKVTGKLAPRLHGRLQVVIELFGEGGLKICDRVAAVGYRGGAASRADHRAAGRALHPSGQRD